MFALDTNVGAKLNVVFDRLLVTLGIKKENMSNKDENNEKKTNFAGESSSLIKTQYDYIEGMGMNDNAMADRMIGGHPTKREPTVSQQPSMMMPTEPMAAYNGGFGSPF